jgi:tetratricopeptide (TPR) repeat protein
MEGLQKNYLKNAVSKAVFSLFVLFLGSGVGSKAQTMQKKIIQLAEESYKAGDFPNAFFYYKSYLEKDSLDPAVWFQFAHCCEKIFLYKKAIYAFEKVQKLDIKKQYKEVGYSLAMSYKITGDYKKAIKLLDKTGRSVRKKNPKLYEQCMKDKKICQEAMVQLQSGTLVQKLPPYINHEEAEYSPFYKDSTLYFVRKTEENKQTFHSLMSAKDRDKNAKKIAVYYPSGEVASMVGGITFHPIRQEIICTLCREEKDQIICNLFEATLDSNAIRTKVLLPLPLNEEGFTFTHPTLFESGGKTKLIFSSNRIGGMGGMDLWMSEKNSDGTWSNPQNAGSTINTSGNEITPFFCHHCKILFFSSDGHEGLGNFDIFQSKYQQEIFSQAENPGWMINSGYNDLYPMYDKKNNQLYFASNRLGIGQLEKEACCNNLFTYSQGKPLEEEEELLKQDSILIRKNIVKSLLPLSLFFNNDEPEPKTKKTKTNIPYDETYKAYISQRQKYISEYSKGLTYDEKMEAMEEIETFFEDSVISGYQDLVKFTDQLPDLLEKGGKIVLTFKGYCSPLASSEYNIALAQRRISSLINYFYLCKNGIFKPYLDKEQLRIVTEDIGELKASPMVSDNPLDKAGSVYSRKAASERKIQIIAVQFEE